MVKLPEWRGKEVLRSYGVKVPDGIVVRSPEEAGSALASGKIVLPCVAKAQVLSGGRGKGGAVRFASTPAELDSVVAALFGMVFKDERVSEVLIEQKLSLLHEYYAAITLDRSLRLPVLIVSGSGGVEIESVDESAIVRIPIHPFVGLAGYERRKAIAALAVSAELATPLDQLLRRIWDIFQQEDAELVEVNPLAATPDGIVALDAKVIIEDDAGFRHPNYSEIRDDRTTLEEEAREKEIAFVQLEGNIGVIANGAGLTMATLDVLAELGGHPGVFLDLGGTDDPKKVTDAFLLMAKAHPKAVFLNIFGGVTRCDTVARGLVEAMKQVPPAERFPLVARIRGNNEAEGVAILREAGIPSVPDLRESVLAVVRAAEGTHIAPEARA